jgi:uncharacterized protein (DUF427 family)
MTLPRIEPGPGQESVWDYPRPPALEDSTKLIQVVFNGVAIAETRRAKRVLETSHPPVYYVPSQDVRMEFLRESPLATWCEWKGLALYYDVEVDGKKAAAAAWYFPLPTQIYEPMKGYIAFYPQVMDACFVDGERVQAQGGDFYGGWITRDIVGPFKDGAAPAGFP